MPLTKLKDKQDFINGMSDLIDILEQVEKDTPLKDRDAWYYDMLGIKIDLRYAKQKHK